MLPQFQGLRAQRIAEIYAGYTIELFGIERGRIVGWHNEDLVGGNSKYGVLLVELDNSRNYPTQFGDRILVPDVGERNGCCPSSITHLSPSRIKEYRKVNLRGVPYPNKCKSCFSPARKLGKLALCSNGRCVSRSDIKAKYKKKLVSRKLPNDIRCSICGSVFMFLLDLNGSHDLNELGSASIVCGSNSGHSLFDGVKPLKLGDRINGRSFLFEEAGRYYWSKSQREEDIINGIW